MKKILLMTALMAVLGFAFSPQARAGVHFVVGVGPGYYGPDYYGGPVVYVGPGYYSWHHGYWHGGYCHRVYHHWR